VDVRDGLRDAEDEQAREHGLRIRAVAEAAQRGRAQRAAERVVGLDAPAGTQGRGAEVGVREVGGEGADEVGVGAPHATILAAAPARSQRFHQLGDPGRPIRGDAGNMDALYTTEALATGAGRDGQVAVAGTDLEFDLAIPREMGGSGNGAYPEQLFAAGYAACFHSALQMVARQQK